MIPTNELDSNALALRPRDAARMLSISERKLWQLAQRGEILSLTIGKCRRYRTSDLRAFLAAQCANADGGAPAE